MASTISKAEAPSLDMVEYGQRLAMRRSELGDPVVPRNAGTRRTESKRALLAAIDAAAKAKGFSW